MISKYFLSGLKSQCNKRSVEKSVTGLLGDIAFMIMSYFKLVSQPVGPVYAPLPLRPC
jgi:hypothetical protein